MRCLILLAVLVAGCQPAAPTPAPAPVPPPPPPVEKPAPLPTFPPPSPEVAALAKGNTAFAVELYKQLAQEPGNVFCSPLSVSVALTMTRRGATGETAGEMDKVLHLPADPHPAMKQIAAALTKKSDGCEVATANALFGQKGFGWKPDFLADLSANYGAGLREVDYIGDTEAARREINGWVVDQTRDRIKELLRPGILDEDSRLTLVNAVYFNAEWHTRFETAKTRDGRFQLDDGSGVTVPFMSGDVSAVRHWEEEVDVLAMPYKGGEYEFVIVRPNKKRLAEFEAGLTAEKLSGWLAKVSAHQRSGHLVEMPKFEMTGEYRLKDPLRAMGMGRAFQNGAEFLGMSGPPSLWIQAVQHKALNPAARHIRVDAPFPDRTQ